MTEIWRYCSRCSYVGPQRGKTCDNCRPGSGSPEDWRADGAPALLNTIPIPVATIRAAYLLGGADAALEAVADVFDMSPEHFQSLRSRLEREAAEAAVTKGVMMFEFIRRR